MARFFYSVSLYQIRVLQTFRIEKVGVNATTH